MLSTVVCTVETVLLDESKLTPDVGIPVDVPDVKVAVLLTELPGVEVPEAVGVVVGALLNEDDSTLELVESLDDETLLLEELSEEPTELLLLPMEEVNEVLLKVVSPIDVDDDFRVVSVGWMTVLDFVLYTVDIELLD